MVNDVAAVNIDAQLIQKPAWHVYNVVVQRKLEYNVSHLKSFSKLNSKVFVNFTCAGTNKMEPLKLLNLQMAVCRT